MSSKAAYSYTQSSMISLSVCLSVVTFMSFAKTAEVIEMPCGVVTWVGHIYHVLDREMSRPIVN